MVAAYTLVLCQIVAHFHEFIGSFFLRKPCLYKDRHFPYKE
ncbi:hypothetical protein LMG33818_001836 [Halomonadaceae bacterium LMG 33818]